MTFSILSRPRSRSSALLENFEIDAGLTYLENEPLGRVTSVPLYSERYHLITAAGTPSVRPRKRDLGGGRPLPLCLLTADMQNRRIIDQHLAEAGTRGAADAGIELDDRAFLACAHRPLVVSIMPL